jgi:hypothetical protein
MTRRRILLLAVALFAAACAREDESEPSANIHHVSGPEDFDAKVTGLLAPPRVVVQFTGPG